MNRVILMGRLGRDPEVRYAASGTAVANFSLATDERRKEGKVTTWHRLVCFDKTAEFAGEYLRKGSQALIEGRLRLNEYETKQGETRQEMQVVVDRLELVGSRNDAPRKDKGEAQIDMADVPF